MLVLIIMLIITIPKQNHAIKLNLLLSQQISCFLPPCPLSKSGLNFRASLGIAPPIQCE